MQSFPCDYFKEVYAGDLTIMHISFTDIYHMTAGYKLHNPAHQYVKQMLDHQIIYVIMNWFSEYSQF